MMLRPGMFLQDRYEILDQIGSGGMSEVYRAKCHKLNRQVAIKVLKEEFSQDSNFVSKFKMEAQAAAGLSHPNIVSVYDVVDEGSLHYIVMELIEGITLKSYILKKGHLGVKETIGIAIQVAQGIAAAHDQHIVHRDIKPQNMIISRDGKVKVADFGIARAVSSQTVGATAVGSVHYISPEQARGGYSDARSDIYSLGITMYEMATGTVPFDGENTVTIALAHLEEPVPYPSQMNPEVTRSLERIILKCTQKKPERRYQDAYELVSDLRHALVDPEDDYLKREPELDESSPTVIIGGGELNSIKEGQRRQAPSGYPQEGEDWEKPQSHIDEIEVPPVRRKPVKPVKKHHTKDDPDLSPQIEKILTTVGIVAAIIIVAVVVVIVAKLGGVFNSGSGNRKSSAAETVESSGESIGSTECRVPEVLGLKAEEAAAALEENSLVVKYEYEASEDDEAGLVIRQSILSGTVVSKQSTVTLTIGEGSGKVDLTKLGLENLNRNEAMTILENQKLIVTVEEESSDTIAKDLVLRYTPEKAEPGSAVTLYVSSGPAVPMTRVPNLTGKTESEAKTILETLKLTLGEKTEEKSEEVAKGKIISQDVPFDTEAPEGTVVNYVLSVGKGTKYVAVVNDDYPLRDKFGPSSGDMQIEVQIVMRQIVNGKEETRVLMQPREMGGDITIPVHYNIEGAAGVLTGELLIMDLTNDQILKTYPLEFLEVDE